MGTIIILFFMAIPLAVGLAAVVMFLRFELAR